MISNSILLCCLLFQAPANEVYLGHTGYTELNDEAIITYLETSASLANQGEAFIQNLRRKSEQGGNFHDPVVPGSRGLVLLWDPERFRPEIGSYRSVSRRATVAESLSKEVTPGNRILKVTQPKENQWVHSIHMAEPVPTVQNGQAGFSQRASKKPIFQLFYRLDGDILYTARSPMIHKRTPPRIPGDSSVAAFLEIQAGGIPQQLRTNLARAFDAEISTQQQRFNEEEDAAFLFKAMSFDFYKSFLDSFNSDDSKIAGHARLNEESAVVTGQINFDNYKSPFADSSRRIGRHFAAPDDNDLVCLWCTVDMKKGLVTSLQKRLEMIDNQNLKEALSNACQIPGLELYVTMQKDGYIRCGIYSSEIHRLSWLVTWLTTSNPKVKARFLDRFLWISSVECPDVDLAKGQSESTEVDYVAKLVVSTGEISSSELPNASNENLLTLIKTAALFEGTQLEQESELVLRTTESSSKLNFALDKAVMRAISMLFLQMQ